MRASVRSTLIWAYVAGALSIATGLLHDAMFHVALSDVKSLSAGVQHAVVWLFLCTGTAVAFAGVLLLLTARGLVRGETLARRVTLASSLFLTLLGVLGLGFGQWAASSLVALAVIALVPWWLTRHATAAIPVGRSGGAA